MGGGEGVRTQTVLVHGQRDEGDAEAGGDLLDQRICQRLDADPAPRPDQGGEGGGDRLPGVAREQDAVRVGPPARG
ncbi:hypothetical protein STRTUCAR8_02540, partial [Streptomyces turgidiscabies Car8]